MRMKSIILLCCLLLSTCFCQFEPHFFGNRSAIVHLFEWKWPDIADECERFLQHKGYGGVQISPPNENVIIKPNRPWWERYQPVSYIIKTRSGDEDAFKKMTRRCNQVGVRIYADVVVNHMAAIVGVGTAGSKSGSINKLYPAVPYGPDDFHGECAVVNYQDAWNVRNCQLVSLPDLDQCGCQKLHSQFCKTNFDDNGLEMVIEEAANAAYAFLLPEKSKGKQHVRQKIIEYMNHLIDLGVAGFRIDAGKHMAPDDLKAILGALKDLNTEYGFASNSRPFVFLEVIDIANEGVQIKDYIQLGAVTEFKFGNSISNVFQGNDKLTYLENWGPKWGFIDTGVPIVFVDNHDTQRDFGKLHYKKSKQYKMATAFMLSHPYGIPKVMSSFDFKERDDAPPQDNNRNLISPKINADDTCGNGFICEHRWRQIYQMVEFRNIVKDSPLTNWWSNGDQQIAFCRGNKGFIAFTNWGDLKQNLQTCLPPGTYCDVISGSLLNGKCTGKSITVARDRVAFISLRANEEDGVIAIHINSKVP